MSEQDGWMSYEYLTPTRDWLVELMRKEWTRSVVMRTSDMDPAMNAGGLYWRMTGIGKSEVPMFMQVVEQFARYRNAMAVQA